MSDSLLSRVKSRLYIRARRQVAHLLEGQYASLHRGRSLDFDDLRDYEPGDEVGDIDWLASARRDSVMVRRYSAERRHRVMFAVAGGKNLSALSSSGEHKHGLAVEAVGVLGWLAIRHGDEVGALIADADDEDIAPFRVSEASLERLLQRILVSAAADALSDLKRLLRQVRDRQRRRTLLVVITDEVPVDEELERLIATLSIQHELLWIELDDANPLGAESERSRGSFDVDGSWQIPTLLRDNRRLAEAVETARLERSERLQALFERNAISNAHIATRDEVPTVLLHMLKTRQYDRH